MRASLVVSAGKKASLSIKIRPGISLIGRSRRCQVRPKTRSVSRRHCAIICTPEKVWIQDLNSQLGTEVNGVRLSPDRKRRLRDGDQIAVGKAKFSVRVQAGWASWDSSSENKSDLDFGDVASGGGLDLREHERSVSPDPFDEMDLATLLTELDEADRRDRIDKIQATNRQRKEAEEAELAAMLAEDFDSFDSDSESDSDSTIGMSGGKGKSLTIAVGTSQPSSDQAAAKGLRQILTGVIEDPNDKSPEALRARILAKREAAAAAEAAKAEKLAEKQSEDGEKASERSVAELKKKASEDRAAAKLEEKQRRKAERAARPSLLQRLGKQDDHWWKTQLIIVAVVLGLAFTSYSVYRNAFHDPNAEHALFED
ncbi:MAG: FHA domain-containing protein [Pirellulaceae bacterium]